MDCEETGKGGKGQRRTEKHTKDNKIKGNQPENGSRLIPAGVPQGSQARGASSTHEG